MMPRYNHGYSRKNARAGVQPDGDAIFALEDSLGSDARALDQAAQAAQAGDFDVALQRVAAARKYLDALETASVLGARRYGMTWTEVGHHLGITQQAASKRFSRLSQP